MDNFYGAFHHFVGWQPLPSFFFMEKSGYEGQKKLYGLGLTQGWVNDESIFVWTIPDFSFVKQNTFLLLKVWDAFKTKQNLNCKRPDHNGYAWKKQTKWEMWGWICTSRSRTCSITVQSHTLKHTAAVQILWHVISTGHKGPF